MAGHSHWAGIKHKKAIEDKKRGKIFTRHAKAIAIAVQEGGSSPESNLKLKFAIDQAKSANVPKNNIERAIKRGSGELEEGAKLEELTYEAMAAGNVAMIITATTDNKNRTVSELKHILTKNGAKLVPSGSAAFQFSYIGSLTVPVTKSDKDKLELEAIDAGAIDIKESSHNLTIHSNPNDFQSIKKTLEEKGYQLTETELKYIPTQPINPDSKSKEKMESLIEAILDHDDIDQVFTNITE